MSEELLIDVGYMIRASKRVDHKERVLKHSTTFIKFLENNSLTKQKLIGNTEYLDDDFKLFESHLTDVGISFFDKTYFKWVGKIDKGAAPTDTTFLERELAKL